MASIFEVDENGQIVYEDNGNGTEGSPAPEDATQYPAAGDPAENIPENEVLESGTDNNQIIDTGIDVSDALQNTEIYPQEQENGESSSGGDSYSISLLSDEVQELLVNALSPASGSLGSSTLDYFDRVVSGLPSDYKYIAYRTSSDDSYDGVLYFGDDYDVENNVITFGKDTTELRVVRESSSGYNSVANYYENEIDGASIAYDLDGSTVYYTNAEVGYPLMGGYDVPFDYSPLIAVGLLCVMALAILQKIFLKR